jgi:hypothetical protein
MMGNLSSRSRLHVYPWRLIARSVDLQGFADDLICEDGCGAAGWLEAETFSSPQRN